MTVAIRTKCVLFGSFLAAMTFASTTIQAAPKVLRVANWLPPVHHMTATLRAWGDELEKASNGELKVEVMGAPLAKPPGQYDLAKNGVVDIAWSVAAYHPKRFQKLMAVEMPFMAPTAEVAAAAAWRWYEKNGFIEKDTSDTHLLALFAHSPHAYHSSKPLAKLEDFKNLKVRAGGFGVEILKTLEAVPVFMSVPETHEAMARGTIDASQFPWETVKGLRLNEVSKYHLEVPGGTYAGIFFMTMSNRTWKELSDAQRAAVNKVSGEWGSRFISRKWMDADQAGIAAAKASGNTINTLSDAETQVLKQKLGFLESNWVEETNKNGLDGKSLMGDLKSIVAEIRN